MAFAVKKKEDDQQAGMNVLGQGNVQTPPQQLQTMQPQNISGVQNSVVAPEEKQTQQVQKVTSGAPQTAKSGLATNVQKYMAGSQEAAKNMAGAGAKSFENQANSVNEAITQKQQSFQDLVAKNRAAMQQGKEFGQDVINQAATIQTPEKLAADKLKRYQDITSGNERYDQASLNLEPQTNQIQGLASTAKDIERADVRRELLRNAIGGRNYTSGKSALDELVMASSPESQQKLKQSIQGKSGALEAQAQAEKRKGFQTMGQMSQDQQQMVNDLAAARTAKETELGEQLKSTLAQKEADRAKIISDIKANSPANSYSIDNLKNLSNEQLNNLVLNNSKDFNLNNSQVLTDLGLTPYENTYGVDVSKYITPTNPYILENIASTQDLARANALASLSGKQQSILNDPALVGQKINPFSGTGPLAQAIAGAKSKYEKDISNVEDGSQYTMGHEDDPDNITDPVKFEAANQRKALISQLLKGQKIV